MNYLGRITTRSELPGVAFKRWIELIARHPALVPVKPELGVDPFTKKPHEYQPHLGAARVVLDGTEVGMMTWAEDGSSQIAVSGTAGVVEKVAADLAAALGCVYEGR
jgi:hypothetical protein